MGFVSDLSQEVGNLYQILVVGIGPVSSSERHVKSYLMKQGHFDRCQVGGGTIQNIRYPGSDFN